MKHILPILLASLVLLSLIACGGKTAAPAETKAPASDATPAPKTDAIVVDTCILKEADDAMINNYTLLAGNPDAPFVDADG